MEERMTAEEVTAFVTERLDMKPFRSIREQVPRMLAAFYESHLRYIDSRTDEEYDEDDAFEYILGEWQRQNTQTDAEDMLPAALLDAYFEALDDL